MDDSAADKTVVKEPNLPKYVIIDGMPWRATCEPEFLRSAMAYDPDEQDVFVNTYPKCGTTWMQNICLQLMHGTAATAGGDNALFRLSPMLDATGGPAMKRLPLPRLIKTHFRYDQMNFAAAKKVITVLRNPKDCLVSHFYHHKALKHCEFENGRFDDFYDLFMHHANAKLAYADYFDFIDSWLPHYNDPNVLTLVYEQMLEDLPSAIVTVGRFLGGAAEDCVRDVETLQRIVNNCTFGEMKGDDGRYVPLEMLTGTTPFIRKGLAKDWTNHLTREQSAEIDQRFEERFGSTFLAQLWKEVMSNDHR